MLIKLIQNAAAGVLTKTRRVDQITPVLRCLHWFPICRRIDFKILRRYANRFALPSCIQPVPVRVCGGPEPVWVLSAKILKCSEAMKENYGDSLDGHLRHFTVKCRTDRKDYTIDCDQHRTVLEAIKSSDHYQKKMKKSLDENIVIQLGKEDRESIVATHFPCSCIQDGESLIITCTSEKVEEAQDQHDQTIHSRDGYSVFYIDTVGGQNAKTKKLFRSKAVKQFKYLCVYGKKGMTVEEALRRDGRFTDDLGSFSLSDNSDPNCITERTRKVDNLDKKKFRLCLERNKRSKNQNTTPVLDQVKGALALMRLRRLGLRTPLPGIFLSNVRSLYNKLNELQQLLGKNKDFYSSSVLCFTETWLCKSIPDSALQLAGFQLFRADRDAALSGKTKGGGICFYINSGWCNNLKVIQQHCSPHLESLFIMCKPFYSPRQFASFTLVGVYIPPQANVQESQRMLADQILCVEQTNPDSLVIVLGDFNKGNLSHELPKYRQFIKFPTREQNILDHCYTTLSGAYHAVPHAALGQSDHVMVHLIPAYKQKLKLCKPFVWTSK
ncbi:uncharacterized protein LOC119911541 [Micropterus salmoides]|uniref:uncharacterized protein LOC119911541 n=1 Tax=Micropterus salmoides TaxID=27706 RepID=UPI0018EA91FF|nr:uncharacterized protein LOC119911541 [Micropterus salmoides]